MFSCVSFASVVPPRSAWSQNAGSQAVDRLVDHGRADLRQHGQRFPQLVQAAEGTAVLALLGQRHPGDAATAQVIPAECAERISDRMGSRIGL